MALFPGFQLDYKVNTLCHLNRTHTKDAPDVDHADSAQLDKVTDHLRCAANQRAVGNAPDLYSIIRNQTMPALDKLDRIPSPYTSTNTP